MVVKINFKGYVKLAKYRYFVLEQVDFVGGVILSLDGLGD
jgi:hypothetical protein